MILLVQRRRRAACAGRTEGRGYSGRRAGRRLRSWWRSVLGRRWSAGERESGWSDGSRSMQVAFGPGEARRVSHRGRSLRRRRALPCLRGSIGGRWRERLEGR